MLTYADEPTIKNAIWKRLHVEGKTEIADITVKNFPTADPPHIQVGIWCVLKDRIGYEGLIDTRSFFDLPASFDRSHLLNEIDQVAEQIKEVRKKTQGSIPRYSPLGAIRNLFTKGTGLRGLWGSAGMGAGLRDLPN